MPRSATDTCESRLKNIFATAGARRRRRKRRMKDWGVEGAEELPSQIWNRKETYLLELDLNVGRRGEKRGLVGNSGLIENICSGPNSLRRAA